MLTNTCGVIGAAEFSLVVAKNAEINLSNSDTLSLGLLWAATAWVSLDPLKHQFDDAEPISDRIERANEAIEGHNAALIHLEHRAA